MGNLWVFLCLGFDGFGLNLNVFEFNKLIKIGNKFICFVFFLILFLRYFIIFNRVLK